MTAFRGWTLVGLYRENSSGVAGTSGRAASAPRRGSRNWTLPATTTRRARGPALLRLKRHLEAAARAKIVAAQKKRWAAFYARKKAKASKAKAAKKAAPEKAPEAKG